MYSLAYSFCVFNCILARYLIFFYLPHHFRAVNDNHCVVRSTLLLLGSEIQIPLQLSLFSITQSGHATTILVCDVIATPFIV